MMDLKKLPLPIHWRRINMPIGDIVYIGAALLFAFMTFTIIRGNFRSKFDDEGNRLDLKEKEKKK